MVTLDLGANDVEPTTALDPLPAGKYLAEITGSEMKPTKAGNGSYLQLEFTVLDLPCRQPLRISTYSMLMISVACASICSTAEHSLR